MGDTSSGDWGPDDGPDEYDEPDESEEMILVCGYPDCCMPGYHFRSECHNGGDIEREARFAERSGKRCADGDWIGDKEPGGEECQDCGCIFISNEGRPLCKVCHDVRSVEQQKEQP